MADTDQQQHDHQDVAAGLRTASFTGVVGSNILWVLQTYVWHGTVPEQVVWTVGVVVPYVVAQISARLRLKRRQKGAQATPQPDPGPTPADTPAPGPQQAP